MRRDLTRPRTWAAGVGRASRKVMGLEDIEKMSGELAMADGYRGQPLIVDRRRLLIAAMRGKQPYRSRELLVVSPACTTHDTCFETRRHWQKKELHLLLCSIPILPSYCLLA
jgi:hypothetical protein